jgi:hypothetical protein
MVQLLIMFCFLLAPVRELTVADAETALTRGAPVKVGRAYLGRSG